MRIGRKQKLGLWIKVLRECVEDMREANEAEEEEDLVEVEVKLFSIIAKC